MPHPLRTILNRRDRQAAANVNASFVSDIGNGQCYVDLRDTGARVIAKRAIDSAVAIGQDVIVSRPDGSGRSRNTGYTIIALAGAKLSGAVTSVQQDTNHAGVTIATIDPHPAVIMAGDAVTITITGNGFTTVPAFEIAPSYGSALLTDVVAPVITDTSIVLTVVADRALPPGDYALTIGTVRTDSIFFQVSAFVYRPSLWVWNYDPALLEIDPQTLALIDTIAAPSGGPWFGAAIVSDGGKLIAFATTSSDDPPTGHQTSIDLPTGAITRTALARSFDYGAVADGGKTYALSTHIVLPSADMNRYFDVRNLDGSGVSEIALSDASFPGFDGSMELALDSNGHAWAADNGHLLRIIPGTSTSIVATGHYVSVLVIPGGNVYAVESSLDEVHMFDLSANHIGTISYASAGNVFSGGPSLCRMGSWIYHVAARSGVSRMSRFLADLSAVSTTTAIPFNSFSRCLTADGTFLYLCDSVNGDVIKITDSMVEILRVVSDPGNGGYGPCIIA